MYRYDCDGRAEKTHPREALFIIRTKSFNYTVLIAANCYRTLFNVIIKMSNDLKNKFEKLVVEKEKKNLKDLIHLGYLKRS